MTKVAYEFNPDDNTGLEGAQKFEESGQEENPVDKETDKSGIDEENDTEPDSPSSINDINTSSPESEQVDSGNTPVKPEFNDDSFLEYYNKKFGTTHSSFDDIIPDKPEKEVNPEPEYDEETRGYLKYKKETGRSLKDWIKLHEDIDAKSPMQLGLEKIKRQNEGMELNDEDAAYLLAEELNIDAENLNDLSAKDKLKLNVLANNFKKELKTEQEKYRQPLENKKPDIENQPSGDYIEINGQKINKADYQRERKVYLDTREKAVSELNKAGFEIQIDGVEGKSSIRFEYGYTDQDKQSMLSASEDVGRILEGFVDDKEQFDHKSFNEGLWWAKAENRKKAISGLLSQARSQGIEEVMKDDRNVNFSQARQETPEKKEEGYGKVGTSRSEGMSVKYSWNED